MYKYALKIEQIGLDTDLSHHSYRSGGSWGSTATAQWIYEEFQSLGLDSWKERFFFITWNLYSKAEFTIDVDGDKETVNDRISLESFTPLHLSWPATGIQFKKIIVYSPNLTSTDLKDKILLVGYDELRLQSELDTLHRLISQHKPYAVIYFYSHIGNSYLPPILDSMEGKLYWKSQTTSGWISYKEGLLIKKFVETRNIITGCVKSEAQVGFGPHYNVIGEIRGENSCRTIAFSAHYDTVTTPGFLDNGAGVAGLLELAKAFSQSKQEEQYYPPCNIRFIAFASEEMGLLGSVNYVKIHGSELEDYVAVLNLDSIGGKRLKIIGQDKFLYDTCLQVARDLGVPTTQDIQGLNIDAGSLQYRSRGLQVAADHLPFANPVSAQKVLLEAWPGYQVDINDSIPVPAITFSSRPLFPRLLGGYEDPGWIHTPYDRSTTPYWSRADYLVRHVKVTALTALRLHQLNVRHTQSAPVTDFQDSIWNTDILAYYVRRTIILHLIS